MAANLLVRAAAGKVPEKQSQGKRFLQPIVID
jgi:hypothetical protein